MHVRNSCNSHSVYVYLNNFHLSLKMLDVETYLLLRMLFSVTRAETCISGPLHRVFLSDIWWRKDIGAYINSAFLLSWTGGNIMCRKQCSRVAVDCNRVLQIIWLCQQPQFNYGPLDFSYFCMPEFHTFSLFLLILYLSMSLCLLDLSLTFISKLPISVDLFISKAGPRHLYGNHCSGCVDLQRA